jgi:hypothetical protein
MIAILRQHGPAGSDEIPQIFGAQRFSIDSLPHFPGDNSSLRKIQLSLHEVLLPWQGEASLRHEIKGSFSPKRKRPSENGLPEILRLACRFLRQCYLDQVPRV